MTKLIGTILGGLAGIPLSYFFQPAIVRQKMGFGSYVSHIGDIFSSKNQMLGDLSGNVILSVIIFAVVGLVIGLVVDKNAKKSN